MCGRFSLTDPSRLESLFPQFRHHEFSETRMTPRFNIAPTQDVAGVRNDGRDTVEPMRWGLHGRINVRSEPLADRRDGANRRCIVFADGFYEWKDKRPVYYTLASGDPFALGGVWEPHGPQSVACAILTCRPNALVLPVHDRMPVIVPDDALGVWLAPEPLPPEIVRTIASPYDPALMRARNVSTKLNAARYDAPDVLEPEEDPRISLF